MDQRSAYIIQILERLGAPLMAAVDAVRSGKPAGDDAGAKDAEAVAALLGKSVQLSIALASTMELKDSETNADAVRLALAALATPLMADHYRNTGKLPADGDIQRMTQSLQSILSFSDSFAPAAETIKRLALIDSEVGNIGDENQVTLNYSLALVPALNAVAHYSFGRGDKKLAQDVTSTLVQRAQELRARLVQGSVDPADEKWADLKCLKALASIYAACHEAETKRLMALNEDQRSALAETGGAMPMDKVWEGFDKRVEMMAVLSENTAGVSSGVESAPVVNKPVTPPPVEAEKPAPVQGSAPASDSPMGFFKPGEKQDDSMLSPPPEQPVQDAELVAKRAADLVPPPVIEPEKAVVPEAQTEPQGDSSNPMSFFKPGMKKPDEGEEE